MDQKDCAFNDDFNKLSISSFNEDYPKFNESPYGSLDNEDCFNPFQLNDDDPQTDTTDSMHKDLLSKLNFRYFFFKSNF